MRKFRVALLLVGNLSLPVSENLAAADNNPPNKLAAPKAALSPYDISLAFGASLLGPITFEQLTQATGTGEYVHDPALGSGVLGLEVLNNLRNGSSRLSLYGRRFNSVHNETAYRYSDSKETSSLYTTIESRGVGFLGGWQFGRNATGRNWMPRVDLGYEVNDLVVSGVTEGKEHREEVSVRSRLGILYLQGGMRYYMIRAAVKSGMDFLLTGPVAVNREEDPAETELTRTLKAELRHGARFGIALGLFVGT